ncbi:MAG: hypothetical protein MZV65_23415 [Chromatiales bacterium]|nr:hypothetical protein [Chromatiales bacterium]
MSSWSPSSRTGYINTVHKQAAKVQARSGITFTLHDLRRTFVTTAEGLDISAYAVKRLVNHKMGHERDGRIHCYGRGATEEAHAGRDRLSAECNGVALKRGRGALGACLPGANRAKAEIHTRVASSLGWPPKSRSPSTAWLDHFTQGGTEGVPTMPTDSHNGTIA